jgi:ribosomal protein S27AE
MSVNLRGIPTRECPMCGGNIIKLDAIFDEEGEVSFYMLDAECSQCGTLLTVITPLDIARD